MIHFEIGLNPLCISLAHNYTCDYTNLLLDHGCDVNRLGRNIYNSNTYGNSRQCNSSSCSLDHPLNICLRHLSQNNEIKTTIADDCCHQRHASMLITKNPNIYAMHDYGLPYPFLLKTSLACSTGSLLFSPEGI